MAADTVPHAPHDATDPLRRLSVPVRRVLLLIPPLLFAGLEILHPQPDRNAKALADASTWFAAFHAIQLVLTGLVAVSVLLPRGAAACRTTSTTLAPWRRRA